MKAMRKKSKKNTNQNSVQQLCLYEKVRENNIKERTELAKSLNINQLSKWLKEAEIPDADESLLPMSDDEIYIIFFLLFTFNFQIKHLWIYESMNNHVDGKLYYQ